MKILKYAFWAPSVVYYGSRLVPKAEEAEMLHFFSGKVLHP